MKISPRYDGPPILEMPGTGADQLAPLIRQRRRMETMLAGLTKADWATQSRCAEWTVQGVVVHLIGVNAFWEVSAKSGAAGKPTRFLAGFDPAATPKQMVSSQPALSNQQVLEQFIASNNSFLTVMQGLSEAEWELRAESPAGHIPIRLMAPHATWDAWVHERDIALPLGLDCLSSADELTECLRYASALSPALAIGFGYSLGGVFAVEATDPDVSFTLEVGDSILLRPGRSDDDAPCLRGTATDLIEALSIRAPLPASAPSRWRQLLVGLATAFDQPDLAA